MSRLIDIDPQIQLEPEPEGYEFRYYTFEGLPNLEVINIESTLNSISDTETRGVSGNHLQGFLLVMIFCINCNKKMHFVRIF